MFPLYSIVVKRASSMLMRVKIALEHIDETVGGSHSNRLESMRALSTNGLEEFNMVKFEIRVRANHSAGSTT